ncbi:hypothetical protein Tco_1413342 [Tanacetum coccineum]
MQTHEGMISKDASEIDNNVAGASHDKDNITEVQSSNNEIFAQILKKTKTKHKMLKEENVLLKKEIETYKERVWDFNEKQYIEKLEQENEELQDQVYRCVKPDVHDTEEILNDVEESKVKMKEKQFQFNYENINSLYDTFVPQTKISPKQEYFLDPSISSGSESSKEMSDLPTPEMPKSSKELQLELTEEVQEMLNIFESMERKVDRTSKKNENFQYKIDQLLDANIANDVKIIVMQSYVEIKNNEEIERFSNESKDGDKFCNDVVEVKEMLSKRIVQLEKYFAKLDAQSIAFEIALQHKTQENKSLKTLKKENENFMASLQIENAHLK